MRVSSPLLVLLVAAAAGAVLATCTLGGAPEATLVADEAPSPADERPNVLVIVWDTVRADRMSLYGYGRPTTPRLEAFAKEAVVYERATSTGMWTLPSHAAMFTGLPGTTHGADSHWRWLDHQHDTLAEVLSDAGYDTFAFSSNLIASPMANLMQGFERVETTFPRAGAAKGRYSNAAKKLAQRKLVAMDASTEISPAFQGQTVEKWGKAVYKDAAPVLHKGLTDFIDERESDAPWFAYLNMMEAHTPRIPSMKSRKALMSDELVALGLSTDASLFAENEYIIGKRDYTAEELEAIGGVYDAAIRDLDDATGDLFDDLRARGILDDTVVILVADHGEALGEHRMFEHRWSVYDTLLHVPLVVRYPERMKAGRVPERVSTIDVFGTVLDVAGVKAPENAGRRSTSLVGRSTFDRNIFAQMLDPFASQLKFARKAHPDVDYSPWLRTYSVAYEGAQKYVHASDGHHMLFDVVADPGELKNLYDAEAAPPLAKTLTDWEAGLTPYQREGRTRRDGAKMQDNETRHMLEQLGYVTEDEEGAEEVDEEVDDTDAPENAAPGENGR